MDTQATGYTNLVLEGGGVLGVAYVGALAELEARGVLAGIVNYAGASAGSIIAGVLACGGTSETVEKVMKTMRFRDFLDYGNKIRAVYNVLCYLGACPGDYFSRWYGKIIGALTGNANITLKQLHEKYGGRLVISVVNLTKRRLEFWDHKLRPDMPVVLAVRASMSIGGIFMPVEIDGDLYVDGGTLCNYPIKAFHYDGPDGDIINPHTIGLMLMADEELSAEYPPVDSLLSYAMATVECLWGQPQKIYMDEQDWKRTIKIPTGNVSSIDFNITRDQVDTLITSGRRSVKYYFDGIKSYSGNTFHCVRASHTEKDEIQPSVKITSNPAFMFSHHNKLGDVKNLFTKEAIAKDIQKNRSYVVLPAHSPIGLDDWEALRDEQIEIEESAVPESSAKYSLDEKIKATVGVSPPIAISQFRLE